MRRREFLAAFCGALAAWPLAIRAQQGERIRRIGILFPAVATDVQFQTWLGAFLQGLALLGWTIGGNVRIEVRWATSNSAEFRRNAAELAALAPDVILAHGSSPVGALLEVTRNIPIVFPVATDPVGAGLVDSLARPGGNATGFAVMDFGMAGKWLELLKEIAPRVTLPALQRARQAAHCCASAVAVGLRFIISLLSLSPHGDQLRLVLAGGQCAVQQFDIYEIGQPPCRLKRRSPAEFAKSPNENREGCFRG